MIAVLWQLRQMDRGSPTSSANPEAPQVHQSTAPPLPSLPERFSHTNQTVSVTCVSLKVAAERTKVVILQDIVACQVNTFAETHLAS